MGARGKTAGTASLPTGNDAVFVIMREPLPSPLSLHPLHPSIPPKKISTFHLIIQSKETAPQIFIQRRNDGGFALRGGRSTRSQTGLAPGASAAHRRRMADKEKPKRKRAVARQASNPLEAAEKRGVPGGLQRGPRRGGALTGPLPPREAAPARQGKRPTAQPGTIPTYYIIILNHRQTLCFQSNPLHRQNGKVRIHLHAVRHGIPQPHGIRRIDHVRRPEATGIGPLYAVKHGCPLPGGQQCLSASPNA